jgi:hypothetical protein
MFGYESRGARTREGLRLRGPTATAPIYPSSLLSALSYFSNAILRKGPRSSVVG